MRFKYELTPTDSQSISGITLEIEADNWDKAAEQATALKAGMPFEGTWTVTAIPTTPRPAVAVRMGDMSADDMAEELRRIAGMLEEGFISGDMNNASGRRGWWHVEDPAR